MEQSFDACAWVPPTTRPTVAPLQASYAPTPWPGSTTPTLADLTTLGVGGPIATYREVDTEAELIEVVSEADAKDVPLLVIGGGSNLVAVDTGFPGVVVRDRRQDIDVVEDTGCGGATVRVAAGVGLDALVARAIEEGWMGLEALSGIPGTVGAAPVQNVGAYGHEISEVISSVMTYDRLTGQRRQLALSELGLGYRTSILKRLKTWGGHSYSPTPRWIITSVECAFRHSTLSAPITYRQLADRLGVAVGERVDALAVRQAVLELRASKGMVLNEADPDARSAGSFFTNPIISEEQAAALPPQAPTYPVYDYAARSNIADTPPVIPGAIKTSAAWLIEHAGIARGFKLNADSAAAVSSRHTLAITCDPARATATDVLELADHIVATVRSAYHIELKPEPSVLCAQGRVDPAPFPLAAKNEKLQS